MRNRSTTLLGLGLFCASLLGTCLLGTSTSLVGQQKDFYDIDTIQKVSLTFKQNDWQAQLRANYDNKVYIKADITINGKVFKDVGVRYRGNSSYWGLPKESEKQAYKISMDAFVPDQEYQSYSTLNFNNNYMDPTWIREPVGYFLFRQFTPAPKSNYLTLTINGKSFGPFINTEQMNKDFMKKHFPSKDGNRYRGEPIKGVGPAINRAMIWLGNTKPPYQKAYQLKSENSKNPWDDLIKVCDELNNSGSQITTTLPPVMDIGNAMRMNAGAIVLLWLDSYIGRYCHNYYLYGDLKHGRMHFMPWDMNNMFGTIADGQFPPQLVKIPLLYRADQWFRPLQHHVLRVPEWKAEYYAYTREISRMMNWQYLGPVIQRFQNIVGPEAAKDPKRIYTHAAFTDNLTKNLWGAVSLVQPILPIKPIVDGRAGYLASLKSVTDPVCTISNPVLTPANPKASQALQFTVKVLPPKNTKVGDVWLRWRTLGAYTQTKMFDDGNHGDGKAGDDVYGVTLPKKPAGSLLEYYFGATVNTATTWNLVMHPVYGNHKPFGVRIDFTRGGPAIRINELMAKNNSTIKDNKGEFDDWLELYNAGNSVVDVSGMYLTDDRDKPKKWKIPTNTALQPGHRLLIWCDEDVADGPTHANFKLDGGGEWVGLVDRDGNTLIDDMEFGLQVADVSTGSLVDGKMPRVTFLDPSPNEPNNLANRTPACGGLRYSHLVSTNHPIRLTMQGAPKINATVTLKIENSTPNASALFLLDPTPAYIPISPTQVVLTKLPPALVLALQTDNNGAVTLPVKIPDQTSLIGLMNYHQIVARGQNSQLILSNGLVVRICPK